MKKITVIMILLIAVSINLAANIKYINYKSFPAYDEHWKDIAFVFEHEYYMEVYVSEWNYDIDKTGLVDKMESIFTLFSSLLERDPENMDLHLFIGEVAHFLYNLDVSEYYEIANEYYKKAMEIEPKDIRSHWFQGFHLSQANKPIEGMGKMQYVSTAMPPLQMPPYFWIEYAISAYYSQMYWSSLRAIEYFKELIDDDVPIADTMYNTLNSKLIIPDVYSEYETNDLWSSVLGKDGTIYKSYLLGMNFRNPYDWELSSSGYKYAKSHFFLKPDRYEGYNNSKVGSTILLLANINYNDSTLLEHMNSIIKEHQTVERVEVDLPYDNVIAYSITDPSLYVDQGGGKLFMIGIQRSNPKTPGMAIEIPGKFPPDPDDVAYYTLDKLYKRFDQDIFYVFLLDASKSIFNEAYDDYFSFIKENVVLE